MESRELDRLREKAIDEGAVRAAELEDQCERQRRMLQELAVASEALAKDNVLLSTELVSVRDRGDDAERARRNSPKDFDPRNDCTSPGSARSSARRRPGVRGAAGSGSVAWTRCSLRRR